MIAGNLMFLSSTWQKMFKTQWYKFYIVSIIVWHEINPVCGELVLTPYVHQHGSRLSHRAIRACQSSGQEPYEIYPAHTTLNVTQPFVEVKRFFRPRSPEFSENIQGHYAIISNPLRTISVLEPGQKNGCSKNIRATVLETAKQKNCIVAINAGYFNTKNGNCLGNVISDGRLAHNSGGIQNAHFGLTKDNSIYTGYVSEAQVMGEQFFQLVGGVVWMMRNETGYVNVSKGIECEDTEETGAMDIFVSTLSSRTAIGHDHAGRVVIVQVDGKTHQYGIPLWDMQRILQDMGVVNAINLDGGGSSTFVVNGTVVNYPSDKCANDKFNCERKVSTVVCVHSPDCDPPDCHGNGECHMGSCIPCPDGWFGVQCRNYCTCYFGATCHPKTGLCLCPPGFFGDKCQYACPYGYYGHNCELPCKCDDSCYCDSINGSCIAETKSDMYLLGKCLTDKFVEKEHLIKEDTVYKRKYEQYVIAVAIVTVISILIIVLLIFYSCACNCKMSHRCSKGNKLESKYMGLKTFNVSDDSDNETVPIEVN